MKFVRNVAMNRSIYNHAECFMRRFKLKISASGTSCGTVALMVLGQFSDICGP